MKCFQGVRTAMKTAAVVFGICCAVLVATLPTQAVLAATVKMSKSKICHDWRSPYYERIKRFTNYPSLDACLADGGRLPKTNRGNKPDEANRGYSRSAYIHWTDADRDCLNTRHELLTELSTIKVSTTPDGCRVLRGRWNDPYSGEIIFDSKDIDIDHLVPLAWAWHHGAANWPAQRRKEFANDPVNLFAVKLELNRSKGAHSPLEWLPPNQKFHCQYVTRYLRVMLIYDFTSNSRDKIRQLRDKICD
ncbi:HNH endonuclease [Pseudidiomarina sp. 1APR75-33.1]|uniref:HNH endonuclease family protein n=1 Tax=Pseudidiomarina terrestris TaxID=2820060 RepID=UPI00264FE3EE|nr:HNH endonuclease family protein [Pseudidiomarina sp. 1APR75-33.1]MDN7126900.1 HNH endonuclease [Pseudidiomarina sp. 1APR75-33.1]